MASYTTHPFAEIFPFASEIDFASLANDIRLNGLIEPIVIYDGAILDGRNRYKACINTGTEPRFVNYDGDDPLSFVISKNLTRRHLNESQRSMVGARLETMKHGGHRQDANLHLGVSRNDAAEKVNVSTRSVASARKVIDCGDDDLTAAVDRGDVAVSVAAKIAELPPDDRATVLNDERPELAIKKVARSNKEKDLARKQTALPIKKYGVVLADPEWKFETFSENGMDRSADNHYPTSVTEEIMARGVEKIAANDCVLFLWATAPMIEDALRVMRSWGFTYKSQAIWNKDCIGTGYWFRNKHEILLVGTRGTIPAPAMGDQFPSVINAPVGAHSAKPEQAYEIIESYFPTLPKIELNARARRDGWDLWGYEAPVEDAA